MCTNFLAQHRLNGKCSTDLQIPLGPFSVYNMLLNQITSYLLCLLTRLKKDFGILVFYFLYSYLSRLQQYVDLLVFIVGFDKLAKVSMFSWTKFFMKVCADISLTSFFIVCCPLTFLSFFFISIILFALKI